jgi:hypothetical protein
LPTIKGVIHLAGIRQDALLPLQTPESLAAVIDPKAVGAWNLHNLVKNLKLDFFILFSSAASLLGSQGQANYAAANAFLDGLADYRHSLGLPAMSIHWGPWAESGMAAWETVVHKNLTSLGFDYLSPEQGLTALESLLNVHTSPVAVFECDWSVYMNRTGQHQSALFKDMISGLTVDTQPCPTVALLWQELEELIPEQRSKKLLSQLTILAREVSGSDTPVAPDRPLMEQGFDSLMAVEFRNQLQKICGFSLPVTLLFTYPGLVEISEFIQKRHYNIQKKSDSDKNYQSADIEQKYEDNKNADNDKMVQSTEAVTETDFAYLDQLTPEELNELIAKDLDI